MEASSSSKVTVEYHDPSGLYPLIAPALASRLPLRNLNWQSPTRPLRQIKQLHVDFVPDQSTASTLHPPQAEPQHAEANGSLNSFDIVRSGGRKDNGITKERRHQIPGLKTSPYLKIYILRCDDKDTYKSVDRARVRSWIADNTPAEGKARRAVENHDASEWFIVHVTLPGTSAGSEPRWRESVKEPDELRERNKSGAKWPGKKPRTVFDRLRSDFNSSNSEKPGSIDRVAQIKLLPRDVQRDLLPTPSIAVTLEETAQERENAWNDLMTKLRMLILGPFDARVRQYEADIAAQEARRTLPGWNFCTFFIHKEGLARALESIGLVEDALVIYDELALGLESAVRDLAAGRAQETVTSFAQHSHGVEERILGSKAKPNETSVSSESTIAMQHRRLDSTTLFGMDYRERIVRSDISLFDFFSYMFLRQKALLLRLAGTKGARAELGAEGRAEGGEDMVLMGEVCWRASNFIHNNARTLKLDLMAHVDQPSNSSTSAHQRRLTHVEVETLVATWTYLVTARVLAETAAPVLDPNATSPTEQASSPTTNGTSAKVFARPSSSAFAGLGANAHPQRSSSLITSSPRPDTPSRLSHRSNAAIEPPRPTSSSSTASMMTAPIGSMEKQAPVAVPGLAELATYRAELVGMQRKVLVSLALQRGWKVGWEGIEHTRAGDGGESDGDGSDANTDALDEVSLDAEDDASSADQTATQTDREGVHDNMNGCEGKSNGTGTPQEVVSTRRMLDSLPAPLSTALSTEPLFHDLYDSLSQAQLHLYALATHTNAALSILIDLALLKFQQSEYPQAEALLKHVVNSYESEGRGWNWGMEEKILEALGRCLLQTGKVDEHVANGLKLLSAVCGKCMGTTTTTDRTGQSGLFASVVESSAALKQDVAVDASRYFADIILDSEVLHTADTDGFGLRLRFRHVLEDGVELDQVSVRIVAVEDASREIWLASEGVVKLAKGVMQIKLQTPVTSYGAFVVDTVVLKAKRLRFVYEAPGGEASASKKKLSLAGSGDASSTGVIRSFVFIYAAEGSLAVDFVLSKDIHMDKPRHLELLLHSGWNEIKSADITLKPTSAGLRLHLADAVYEGIRRNDKEEKNTTAHGRISIGALRQQTQAIIKIPYTVENAHLEISLRVEVHYETIKGSYTYFCNTRLVNELPLDVAVSDTFLFDVMASVFTVKSTSGMPLSITETKLDDSSAYAVEAPPAAWTPMPMQVFEGQPISLVYRVTRKPAAKSAVSKPEAALALRMQYKPIEQLVIRLLCGVFAQDLSESAFATLKRMLLPWLADRCKTVWSTADIAVATLLNSMKIPSYDILGWQDVVSTLAPDVRFRLSEWLRSWHSSHLHLPFSNGVEDADEDQLRSITISVEVPTVEFVHRASLELRDVETFSGTPHKVVTLGHPIKAELRIQSSNLWSTRSVLSGHKPRAEDSSTTGRFIFQVREHESGTWIIGGQRKAHFTARVEGSDDADVFALTLIPIQTGVLLLPSVEISLEPAVAGASSTGPVPTFETMYVDSDTKIRVIHGRSTTRLLVKDIVVPPEGSSTPGESAHNTG